MKAGLVFRCALTLSALTATAGEFYWLGAGNWRSYASAEMWTVDGTGKNPDGLVPGENDWIRTDSSSNFYFDFGGLSVTNKGFTNLDNWNTRNFGLRNGSLTITGSFTNYYIRPTIYDGCRFVHAATASSRLGFSAARSRFTVMSGAELEMYGTVYLDNGDFLVESGAKAVFDFTYFAFNEAAFNQGGDNYSQDNLGIFNSGETRFPNGFVMYPRATETSGPPEFRIRQQAGTMVLGGDMKWERPSKVNFGRCYFHLDGGRLEITDDVKISGFDINEMTAGAVVDVEIADGKTLDLSDMEFGEDTTLNVSGSGKLVLGDSAPAALNLGSTSTVLRFTDHVRIPQVTGYENATYEMSFTGRRGLEITSDVEGFLDAVKSQVAAPDGCEVESAEWRLAYFPSDSKTYYTNKQNANADFTNPSHWLTDGVEAADYPGYNDYLHPNAGQNTLLYWKLQGRVHKLRGLDYNGAHAYPNITLTLDNGTVEFTESFTNRRVTATMRTDARLVIPRGCKTVYAWQGAVNTYRICEGSRFDCFGDLLVGSLRVTNEVGGVVNFAPGSFTLTSEGWHLVPCWFDNRGAMDFPSGLEINSTCGYSNQLGPWSFNQRAGVMRFGGPLVNVNAEHEFRFNLSGGTLKVDSDLSMGFFTEVGMPDENVSASIDVAADRTLDWTNAVFASGTELFKKGDGTLRIGADSSDTLTVSGGVLRVEGPVAVPVLTVAEGAKVEFASGDVEIGSGDIAATALFSVDAKAVKRGRISATLVRSQDAALLEAIRDRAVIDEKYRLVIVGDAVHVVSALGLRVIVK